MTLEEMVADHEEQVARLAAQVATARGQALAVLDTIKEDKRTAATPEEDAQIDAAIATRNAKGELLRGAEVKLAAAKAELATERAVAEQLKVTTETGATSRQYDQVARIGQEPRTYTAQKDKRGSQFLKDVGRQFLYQDPGATERLSRHMAEERVERADYLQRAVPAGSGTGNFTGLVVPQYLTDLYAPAVAAMRPFADACHHQDLPSEGMTVNISRITTPTLVDAQSAENAAVDGQQIDDTLLSIPVQTAAGQAILSRQALDRGTGIEGVLMDDLFRRYGTFIDSTLINQATTGLSAVAQANTITSGLTAQTFYSKVLGSVAGTETALLGMGKADLVVMSTSRWGWYQAQAVSTWPAVQQPNYDPRTFGSANAVGYDAGFRGTLPNGLPVIVDANVPSNLGTGTNQDEVYVVPTSESWLWEDPDAPLFIRAEQPAASALGVLYVLYGYFAYTFGRYANSHQKISGAALTPPTF